MPSERLLQKEAAADDEEAEQAEGSESSSSPSAASSISETALSTLARVVQRYLTPEETLVSISSSSSLLRRSFSREDAWRRLCLRDFASFLSSEPSVSPVVRRRPGRRTTSVVDDEEEDNHDDEVAAAPTWQVLYGRLRGLHDVQWRREVGGHGTSPDLRSDPCEYGPSDDGTVLIRSGGKYFFVVSVAPVRDVGIVPVGVGDDSDDGDGDDDDGEEDGGENGAAEGTAAAASADSGSRDGGAESSEAPSSRRISKRRRYGVRFGRWSKLRIAAAASSDRRPLDVPGPRTGHTLTPLPCGRRLALFGGRRADVRQGTESADGTVYVLTAAECCGGGGSPFTCDDDLGSSASLPSGDKSPAPARRAVWSRPRVAGKPPSPRLGHTALPLWKALLPPTHNSGRGKRRTQRARAEIVVIGGSKGSSPLRTLEVCVLDLTDPDVALWSTVRSPSGLNSKGSLPAGRFGHSAFFVPPPPSEGESSPSSSSSSSDSSLDMPPLYASSSSVDVIVFGGRQYSLTLGFLDSWRGTLTRRRSVAVSPFAAEEMPPAHDVEEDVDWEIQWRPQAVGQVGPGSRRGHSAYALGRKLIVFGGSLVSDESSVDNGNRGSGGRYGRYARGGGGGGGGELASSELWIMDAAATDPTKTKGKSPTRPWYVPATTFSVGGSASAIVGDNEIAAPDLESEEEDGGRDTAAGEDRPSPPPPTASSDGSSEAAQKAGVTHPTSPESHSREATTTSQAVPAPRRGHSARVVCGRLVISGGYGAGGEKLDNRDGYELCFC